MNAPRMTAIALILAALVPVASATAAVRATTLSNGDRVRLMGVTGTARLYRIHVPDHQNELVITTSGGSGDLDLFASHGRQPTTRSYQYRSAGSDNEERISVHNPRSGWWYVLVTAYRGYVGTEMHVRHWGNDGGVINRPPNDWDYPKDDDDDDQNDHYGNGLRDGQTIRGLSGYRRSERIFRIEVPRGTDRMTIRTRGSNGDPDLYLRHGRHPERGRHDAKSIDSGPDEHLVYDDPASGTWYLLVYGYRRFSDLTLSLDLDGDDGWPGHDDRPDWPGHARIRFTNPTNGDVWYLGDRPTIRWRATGRARRRRVQVQFSVDAGRTWQRGANMPRSIQAATGQLQVNLPANATQFITNHARVRLVDVDRRVVLATSDPFAVRQRNRMPRHPGRRRPRPRRGRDARPDAGEPDTFKKPAHLQVGQSVVRTIHDEGEVDYIRIPIGQKVGRYAIRIDGLRDMELEGALYVRRKDHDDRRIAQFEVDEDGKTLVVEADWRTYWYTLVLKAEDDDDEGSYRVRVEAR